MKITKKDFQFFKKECQKWIDKLHLNDWKIYYGFQKDEDNFATFSSHYRARQCTIKLAKSFGKKGEVAIYKKREQMKETAFHEVVEGMLLARLEGLARDRNWDDAEWEAEAHAVIHRLQRILL